MEVGKGSASDRGKFVCQKIMAATNTKVEYSTRKDKSITVVISGKQSDVNEAKKQVMAQLTQQGSISVFIPKVTCLQLIIPILNYTSVWLYKIEDKMTFVPCQGILDEYLKID